jgi:hypothetical protein
MTKLIAYLLFWLLGLVALLLIVLGLAGLFSYLFGDSSSANIDFVLFVLAISLLPAFMARGLYVRFLKIK